VLLLVPGIRHRSSPLLNFPTSTEFMEVFFVSKTALILVRGKESVTHQNGLPDIFWT
jgi:hypothetical protein